MLRTAAGRCRASSLICPHEAGSVGVNSAGFLCAQHGATFHAAGTWTGGLRTTNLANHSVSDDVNAGTLTITS